jgi:hypothetical protein
LLHRTSSVQSTWAILLVLIWLHLLLNYRSHLFGLCVDGRAVKSIVLIDINRQRASLILSNLFDNNLDPRPLSNIPTPIEISKQECLFMNNKILGNQSHTADIGVPSTAVINLMRGPSTLNSFNNRSPRSPLQSQRPDLLHIRHGKLYPLVSTSQ